MNPFLLHGVHGDKIRASLNRYENWEIDEIFGNKFIQASYRIKSGHILQDIYESGGLVGKEKLEADARSCGSNPDAFQSLADKINWPKSIPVSLWAMETLKKQRELVGNTIWNDKLVSTVEQIVFNLSSVEPGNYQPSRLEGPPGSMKTHAAMISAILMGRPLMYVRGEAGDNDAIQAKSLVGGDVAMTSNRLHSIKERAYYGVLTPSAQFDYISKISSIVESGVEGKSLEDEWARAHNSIEDFQWEEIADFEKIPRSGNLAIYNIGKVEIGRRNGAFILVDEYNRFDPSNQNVLESFFENKLTRLVPNAYFALTANPLNGNNASVIYPTQESLRDRTILINVDALSKSDYAEMIVRSVAKETDQTQEFEVNGKRFTVKSLIEARAKALGVKIEEFGLNKNHETVIGQIGVKHAKALASQWAELHTTMLDKTSEGGDLDVKRYGKADVQPVTIRLLNRGVTHLNAIIASRLTSSKKDTIKDIQSRMSDDVLVSAMGEVVRRNYISPYIADIPHQIDGPMKDVVSTKEILEEIVHNTKMDQESLLGILDGCVKGDHSPKTSIEVSPTIRAIGEKLGREFSKEESSKIRSVLILNRYPEQEVPTKVVVDEGNLTITTATEIKLSDVGGEMVMKDVAGNRDAYFETVENRDKILLAKLESGLYTLSAYRDDAALSCSLSKDNYIKLTTAFKNGETVNLKLKGKNVVFDVPVHHSKCRILKDFNFTSSDKDGKFQFKGISVDQKMGNVNLTRPQMWNTDVPVMAWLKKDDVQKMI